MKKIREYFSKNQGVFLSILSLSLILILVGGLSIYADGGSAGSGVDITNNTSKKIKNFYLGSNGVDSNFLIKDGVVRGTMPEIFVGNTIKLEYEWTIEDETKIKENNYFDVVLPLVDGLDIEETTNKPLFGSISSSGVPQNVGFYKVFIRGDGKKVVRTTFNNGLPSNTRLISGLITATASAKKEIKNISITSEGFESISLSLTVKPPSGGGGSGSGGGGSASTPGDKVLPKNYEPIGDNQPKISKYTDYRQEKGGTILPYRIFVNKDEMAKIYQDSPSFVEKSGIEVIDELPSGLRFSELNKYNFLFHIPLYAPAIKQDDGTTVLPRLSDNDSLIKGKAEYMPASKDFQLADGTVFAKLLTENGNDETWETFKTRVKEAGVGENLPHLGIYKNVKLYLYVPKLRDDRFTYNKSVHSSSENLKEAINGLVTTTDSKKKISRAQADKMLAAYHDNKPIVCFAMYFNTELSEPIFAPKEFLNQASLKWSTGTSKSKEVSVTVSDVTNVAWLKLFDNRVKIEKTWIGNTDKDDIAKFQLIDFSSKTQIGTDEYELTKTNEDSANSSSNKPWIREITGLSDKKFYSVKEVAVPTNKHKYRSEIIPDYTKAPHTIRVKNIELRDIKVTKTWELGEKGRLPASINVNLVRNGEKTPIQTATISPTSDGKWEYIFKDVDRYKELENGTLEEILYDVIEEKIADFAYSTEFDKISGIISLKNTYTPSDSTSTPRPTPPTPSDPEKTPSQPPAPSDPGKTPPTPPSTGDPGKTPSQPPAPSDPGKTPPTPPSTDDPSKTPPSPDEGSPSLDVIPNPTPSSDEERPEIPPAPTPVPLEDEPSIEIPVVKYDIPSGDTELPKIPETPEIVKVEDPEDDLLIEEDNTPLGDTKVEKIKNKTKTKTKTKNTKTLAKTGGMEVLFGRNLVIILTLFAFLGFCEALRRKRIR